MPNQTNSKGAPCPVCSQTKDNRPTHRFEETHPIEEMIRQKYPDPATRELICEDCYNQYRTEYVMHVLEVEREEFMHLKERLDASLKKYEERTKTQKFEGPPPTAGERIADKVAEFGGSWTFIVIFGVVLLGWMMVNSLLLAQHPFDPFPYILLNLLLSTLAAIQAPIIMMSQNRVEARDRKRAEYDFRVNLKAEMEVRHVHDKLDFMIDIQWQRFLEIQRIQIELLEELSRKHRR